MAYGYRRRSYGGYRGYRTGFRRRGYARFGARRSMGYQPRRRGFATRRVRFGGRRW